MMMPVTSFSSSSSSSSSASATVRVEKATSEFLIGPDWTMNIDICDAINSNNWLAKDVVKALKKRLQHKNPKVQLLALTLLETMVKNCGEHVHFQIAERSILPEMIKIVKKKTDMHVRDKILFLLDSWQEAFGGRSGKYPQYYFACEELRLSGIEFPRRSPDAVPIFTPPLTHPMPRLPPPGYGMPINSLTRLDEAMASEIENLSLSNIESMKSALDLLSDLLREVSPNDRKAVKDEVIVDVVDRCRSNQKKLMQMLTTTGDEELLGKGLELNDALQSVLAQHDAMASGSPLPTQVTNSTFQSVYMNENHSTLPAEATKAIPVSSTVPSAPAVTANTDKLADEEEEEEDDFAQLARRHSKTGTMVSHVAATNPNSISDDTALDPSQSMALNLVDPPPPVNTTKAQDMIDFLSLTLSSTNDPSPQTPSQNTDQTPIPKPVKTYPSPPQPYPDIQAEVPFNSYVVPWAQAKPQPQPAQSQPAQYFSSYPPPPWAATPGYYSNPYPSTTYAYSSPLTNTSTYMPSQSSQSARNLQPGNSFVADTASSSGQKPFIPSYRLFEDLNVLGNAEGRGKMGNVSPRLGENQGQSVLGGKK